MIDTGVSNTLPLLFEDIGVYKKKLSKGSSRSRPPSAFSTANLDSTSPKLDSTDIRRTEPSISDRLQGPNSKHKISEISNLNKNSQEEINLAEMSRTVENSLASLSRIDRPLPPKPKFGFKFLNKTRTIKENSSDKESSDQPQSESGSVEGSSASSRRGRFRQTPSGLSSRLQQGARQGDDVFLKSIFGVGARNTSGRPSVTSSIQERSSDRGVSGGNPGASGTRMRVVRNILVPVSPFNQKALPTDKKFELDFTKKSSETGGSRGSNKKELFKMLQNVENRDALTGKKGHQHQRKISSTSSNTSYNNSASKHGAGRSPVKIMKLVVPESTVRDTEKKHYKLMNSVDNDSYSMQSGLMARKLDGLDMNQTMPNLKDALEREAHKNEHKLIRTNTSMQIDDDEVLSCKVQQTLTWANTTFSDLTSLSRSAAKHHQVVLGKMPQTPKLDLSKMKDVLKVGRIDIFRNYQTRCIIPG